MTSFRSSSDFIRPSFYWLFSDPFHSIFFAVTSSISLLTNSLLIYTILKAKSAEMDNYRYLLLCFALCDMVSSTMHFVALPNLHMTSAGCWFIPRNEGIFKSSGGTLAVLVCFVFVATYYQIFLILSYHFLYRLKVLVRGRTLFEHWRMSHWVVLCTVGYVLYISAFMWCGWHAFLPSDYSRMVAPSFFINLYSLNASDPDTGFFHITWKREHPLTGLMEWHNPTVVAMTICAGLFLSTGTVMLGCIAKITKSLKTAELSKKTRKMQQQLFRALLIQTVVPCVFSYIPLATILLFPLTGIDLGAIGNPLIMTTAIFPSIDALFIIFLIPRFRISVFRTFHIFHATNTVSDLSRKNSRKTTE